MATLITNNGIQRIDDNALEHFGILGMKWGIRRYQPYGEGGYNPKKKGKYVGKLNPQQKREYKLSKQENRERAARATVISGVAAGALTAAGVFSPYSIPLSMLSTAAVNTGINFIKNHKYKTFLKEQNEIHDEQINIGRDYVKQASNASVMDMPNNHATSIKQPVSDTVMGKSQGGQGFLVKPMSYKLDKDYGTGQISLGKNRKINYGGYVNHDDATSSKNITKVMKSFEQYEKNAKTVALNDSKDWWDTANYSDAQKAAFKKNLKINYIGVHGSGNNQSLVFSLYDDNNKTDLLGGHEIDVEVDLKTGKMRPAGING